MAKDERVRTAYRAPQVTYHGRVGELTRSHHLVLGSKAAAHMAAAFAASVGGTGGTGGVSTPVAPGGEQVLSGGGIPGGGSGAAGATGSGTAGTGGGSGKEVPFTGPAVIGVAGVWVPLAEARHTL